MKKLSVILFIFISVTALCQETSYMVEISSGSELALLTENNSREYINTHQIVATPIQLHSSIPLKSKLDYLEFSLIRGNGPNVKNKIFPDLDPIFSLFLNRKILYSGRYIINSGFSNSFSLAVSFDAGLRLPLTNKLLIDVGIKNEFGVMSNRKLYIKDIFSNKSSLLGLILGLSYKL
jgi:hypothetical protein